MRGPDTGGKAPWRADGVPPPLLQAFAGVDWITRIQKALLMLLLLAQVDMFIGSFVDIEFGTAYVLKIDEDGYQQVG